MRQEAVSTAVSPFAELPILQRSVVILKDVLDEPLAEIPALLDLTIDAVKAHLARGRVRFREINAKVGQLQGESFGLLGRRRRSHVSMLANNSVRDFPKAAVRDRQ